MTAQAHLKPVPFRPERSVTFRAWLNSTEVHGCAALADALTFEDVLAAVQHWASHKDNISILRDDAGKRSKQLNVYTIKQESQRKWRKDPVTLMPIAYRKQYPALIFAMMVDAFEPTRPFDAFRDCPVGRDLTLVEAR